MISVTQLLIPITGRFVCTNKNDDTRRYPYMYIMVHDNTMGYGNFYTLQTPTITLPKTLEVSQREIMTAWCFIFCFFFSTWPIQGWLSPKSTPTLITQFFASKFIKVELNSNHLESFSQLQSKIKISDSGIRKNVLGSIFQRPNPLLK